MNFFLFALIFSSFCSYLQAAHLMKDNAELSQKGLLTFMIKCHDGLFDRATITTDSVTHVAYRVTFHDGDGSGNGSSLKNNTILPFINEEHGKKFFDVVSSIAATHSRTTTQATSFIQIMLGKKSGKIEFEKRSFTVQD